MSRPTIKPHSVILFQGDSITDTGRSRSAIGPNSPDGLGFGYPRLVAGALLDKYPDHHLQIYNRGISGDRIFDLARRWEKDSLGLRPDLISILIGVNDTWNYIFTGIGSSPEEYKKILQKMIQDTRERLPDTQVILCEPFILLTGEVTAEWLEDISKRQAAVRDLAGEYQAVLVPFQSSLEEAARQVPPFQLLEDGVHPTEFGHKLLAECWIKTVVG